MQVKQQCYILGASVLVPVTIMVMGFNLFSAVLGVLFYIGFLIYSLQRGEPSRPEEEKDEDIEAISTSLSLFWPVCFSTVVAYMVTLACVVYR